MNRFSNLVWISLALVVAPCGHAQTNSATLTGIITDSAGALIPNVEITVRNKGTNASRRAATSALGSYVVRNLAPGEYELSAVAAGFRTYRRTNIILEVEQTLRLDVSMELGPISETIEVKAEAPALNTETGATRGDTITNSELQRLPLEGRNFTDLAYLLPEVLPDVDKLEGAFMNVGGARSDNVAVSVDGIGVRNPYGGTLPEAGGKGGSQPSLDAVQEFKMETSGYSAEFGSYAGGVINLILRSGTNSLHGTLFENVRNSALDARSFFDNEKPPNVRHQYGATASGPLRRDRIFFLANWQGYLSDMTSTKLGRVPTARERTGDFSQSLNSTGGVLYLTDPLAGGTCTATSRSACFPNNIIPASRIDPIARKIADFYPLPNRSDAAFNEAVSRVDSRRDQSFLVKVDYHVSDRDNLAFRYQTNFAHSLSPGADLPQFATAETHRNWLIGIDYFHSFTPRTMLDGRLGASRWSIKSLDPYQGKDYTTQFGIPGTSKDPRAVGFPYISVLNYMQIGPGMTLPTMYSSLQPQGYAAFTHVQGRHIWKWGITSLRTRLNVISCGYCRGVFQFQDRWTNNAVGDFLLGVLNNTSRRSGFFNQYARGVNVGLYFNDDYKVTRSLTVNLGLRWDYNPPPVEKYGRQSSFVPELQKLILANPAAVPNLTQLIAAAKLSSWVASAADYDLPPALVRANTKDFAPRFGFAWRPFGDKRSVLRGGYGVFYSGNNLKIQRSATMSSFPYSLLENYNRVTTQPGLLVLSNPFPAAIQALGGTTTSTGVEAMPGSAYLQQYSLTCERDLGAGTIVEVGYSGSKGTHLPRYYDANQPIRSQKYYQTNTAFPRPVPGFGSISFLRFISNSNYNAGTISFHRRGRGSFFYRASYTFSKSIDDSSSSLNSSPALDPLNLRLERARSDFDRRHALVGSVSWDLPVGQGKRLLGSANRWVQNTVGGWQLSAVGAVYSGSPITVTTSGANQDLGESTRPNRLGLGEQPTSAGAGRKGVDYPWFRLDDFEAVPRCDSRATCGTSAHGFSPFAPGNSGRNILDGPGLWYINTGLMKNFRVRENHNLQVRCDVFNLTNHPNFLKPVTTFNTVTGGRLNATVGSGTNGSSRGGGRETQLSIQYRF